MLATPYWATSASRSRCKSQIPFTTLFSIRDEYGPGWDSTYLHSIPCIICISMCKGFHIYQPLAPANTPSILGLVTTRKASVGSSMYSKPLKSYSGESVWAYCLANNDSQWMHCLRPGDCAFCRCYCHDNDFGALHLSFYGEHAAKSPF